MNNKTNYIDAEKIGYRLRMERENLKITREKFAELVDLSPLYIGQLERGERQMSINALANISKTLHISTDYLLFGKTTHSTNSLFKENFKDYITNNNNSKKVYNKDLITLLGKCDRSQLELMENILRLIMPHLK